MDVGLALAAALLFSLGTVLQAQVASQASEEEARGAGFLLQLARKPRWLAGIAADAGGFVARPGRSPSGGWWSCSRCWPRAWCSPCRWARSSAGGGCRAASWWRRARSPPGSARSSSSLTRAAAWRTRRQGVDRVLRGLRRGRRRAGRGRARALAGRRAALLGNRRRHPVRAQRRADQGERRAARRGRAGGVRGLAGVRAGGGGLRGHDALPGVAADRRLASAVATQMVLDPMASVLLGSLAFDETIHDVRGALAGSWPPRRDAGRPRRSWRCASGGSGLLGQRREPGARVRRARS